MSSPRPGPDDKLARSFPGLHAPERTESANEPASLGNVLSQLFQLRGYGRQRATTQLYEIWRDVAGREIAAHSRAVSLRGGVLHVTVFNGVLLGELNGFHKQELLEKLRRQFPESGIRDIKFRLQSRK